MFLDYFALVLILIVLVMAFYAFIYVHELPYEAAKHRNHPQQDAIYVACWISLFTLHAIWPLVFIWALSYRDPRGAGHGEAHPEDAHETNDGGLSRRFAALESRLQRLEAGSRTENRAESEVV